MINLEKQPYKRPNQYKARDLFEKQYKDCLSDFGSHFDFTDYLPYKGTLYTSKGKFNFAFHYASNEWFLVSKTLWSEQRQQIG